MLLLRSRVLSLDRFVGHDTRVGGVVRGQVQVEPAPIFEVQEAYNLSLLPPPPGVLRAAAGAFMCCDVLPVRPLLRL